MVAINVSEISVPYQDLGHEGRLDVKGGEFLKVHLRKKGMGLDGVCPGLDE